MTDSCKAARGRKCTVRIPSYCNGNPVGTYNPQTVGGIMYYMHFYKFTLSQAMPKGILIAIATLVGGRFGKQNPGYNGDVKTCRDNDDGSGLLKIYITVSIKTTQTGRVPYFNFRVVGY
ncbi:nuclease domain-containing protein [Phytobacter sp. SCO41]|uniref:Nuclease domain-containing protein n=1 Tax=Citrobacter bitternis TaxID=1585982 RepID=A0ABW1Q423_9ENTR